MCHGRKSQLLAAYLHAVTDRFIAIDSHSTTINTKNSYLDLDDRVQYHNTSVTLGNNRHKGVGRNFIQGLTDPWAPVHHAWRAV